MKFLISFIKKNKKIMLVLTLIIIFVSAFLIYKRAETNTKKIKATSVFSKYNIKNGFAVMLLQDGNEFVFYDSSEKELFRTNDKIQDFYILDNSTIAYRSYNYVKSSDKNYTAIKVLKLSNKKLEEIYGTYDKIMLNTYENSVFIYNYNKKQIIYGKDKASLKSIDVNQKFTQIFKSKERLFLAQYKTDGKDVFTDVYEFKKNNISKLFTYKERIINISADSHNSNKIYCLYETTKPSQNSDNYDAEERGPMRYELLEKYIVNLSPFNSGEIIHSNLTGSIISEKDRMIFINRNDYCIYVLNDDFSIGTKLAEINKNVLWNFIQTDDSTGLIYYIDTSGHIKSI